MNAVAHIIPTRKIWPTPGGVHPPDNKTQSLQLPLEALAAPPQVILPLSQHLGTAAKAMVAVGDAVKKGQLIASAKGHISANIHASISGKVTAIESRPIAHPSGMNDTCIVIENDYQDTCSEFIPCANFRQLHNAEILNRIEMAGIVGMGGAGFPTTVKLKPKHQINTLIINATECEPYITADDSLMQNHGSDIIEAIDFLAFLLEEPAEILLAIEDNKTDAIKLMQELIKQSGHDRIDVVVLPTKYPSGGEKQLIQMLTGKEVSSGGLPAELGIVCQNVATVVAAYDAVAKGLPLISRIVTVAGNALAKQQNLRIPIGTPIEFIFAQQGLQEEKLSRLVMGGPMMGFTLNDTGVPVIKTTNCLLALDAQEAPPPQPAMACIRCGMCAEACPASLLPQQLYWYARAQEHEKLEGHHLFDCIECGACSYACPSHIPLVQYYRAAKAEIRQSQHEKQQSDRARQRFEFHKLRIESEKLARVEARKLASEKAKQKKVNKAASIETIEMSEAPSSTNDEAKVKRNLLSMQDRLSKLQLKLQNGDELTPEQMAAIQARIKDTELKCQNLQAKLPSDIETPEKLPDSPIPVVPAISERVQQWQKELLDTRSRLEQTDAHNEERMMALKMAEKILLDKITNVDTDEAPASFTLSKADDRIQRAMENALLKASDQDET